MEQHSVRPARPSVGMLFVMRHQQELGRQGKISMYACLIGVHKTYDSADRETDLEGIYSHRRATEDDRRYPPIPRRHTRSRTKDMDEYSEWFEVKQRATAWKDTVTFAFLIVFHDCAAHHPRALH